MMSKSLNVETNTLSLLKYALMKKGVPDNYYYIGNDGDERQHNDKLCLLEAQEGEWIVLYIERGLINQRVCHSNIMDAATDFYWKLVRQDTPWDYRAEWEAETGQQL